MSGRLSKAFGFPATVLALLLLVFAQAGGVQGMFGSSAHPSAHHSMGSVASADEGPIEPAAMAAAPHTHSTSVPYQAIGSHDRSGSPVAGEIAGCMISCYAMLVPPGYSARPEARRISQRVDKVDQLRAQIILPRPEPPKTRS